MLNCESLSEFNLHSAVSSCVAFSSCVAILYCVGISSCRASLLALASLLVSADLFQGSHSQAETHMRGERVRHKIASREGRASSVVARRPLSGSGNGQNGMMRASFRA